MFSNIKIGDFIRFGHYPQSADGQDNTPIDWKVLEVKDGKALLISEYVLESKEYHEEWEDVTWEECTLRHWLNQEFLNLAFSQDEQKRIPAVNVPANENPEYDTDWGNDTTDKIFLLSIMEAEKYFSSDEDRMCVPTAYAIVQGAWTSDDYKKGGEATCWWWLRSPGIILRVASYVNSVGSADSDGNAVSDDGGCVRPALWINLDD